MPGNLARTAVNAGVVAPAWIYSAVMRHLKLVFAFLLGACATAAANTSAAPPATAAIDTAPKGKPAPPPTPDGNAATVTSFEDVERRRSPKGNASIAILARGENAFIGRLEMDPGGQVPEHSDATEEYIHVLQGGGTLYIDHQKHEIGPGSTIYMPANALVRFEGSPNRPLVALQVFAGPEPADKYDAWPVTGVR